ncbi:hypothetical protein [Mycolicibacterium monacense]|nr:hypothetical protein [Mycolicibacterium monacense]
MCEPARITERIANLAGEQMILDKIFHTLGQPLVGGAMLFNSVRASDFLLREDRTIKQRGPGDEYPVAKGVGCGPTARARLPQGLGRQVLAER